MNPIVTTTETIDPIFMAIFAVCLVLLIGITAAMVWFVVRYHRSRAPEPTSQAAGNLWLEIVWTVLPTVIVLAMFYYGWAGYLALRNVPKGALAVTATASMWSWHFSYANGKSAPKLYVPAGRPVKVDLVSTDVIHGFYLPAFRVKRDVVPGMKNHVWFTAPRPGSYDLFCSEYCGTGHSAMISTVEALPEAEFTAWLAKAAPEPIGKALLQKHGCLGCHSLDGKPSIGPTFQGIFGRRTVVVTDGRERTITVDEGYLRRSVVQPKADLAKGFPAVMPPYPSLPPEELAQMVEFLKGVK